MLTRLASRHPKRVLVVTLVAAIAAGVLGGGVADRLDPYGAEDPASETVQVRDRLTQATGLEPDAAVLAVVETRAPVRTPASRRKVLSVARAIAREPEIGRVTTFYDTRDPRLVSRDGRATYVVGQARPVGDKAQQRAARRLVERFEDDPAVTIGGVAAAQGQVNEQVESDLTRAELAAFPILFLLSLLFFRSLVAALLPLLVGGLAIVGTFVVLRLASEALSVSVFALNLTTALGLGLAIDYSLFIVSRYREEIARVGAGPEALRRTLATAGRTVLFSSLTVAAALASLLTFPQRFLYSMGIGGVSVALIAAAASLIVLPALLALLGERVNALAPRWLQRAAGKEARSARAGGWYRLSRFVMRRPGRIAATSAVLLIALGLPFLGVRFVWVDASILPTDKSARQANDLIEQRFVAEGESALQVLVEAPARSAAAAGVRERLARLDGARDVLPPRPAGPDASLIEVVPRDDAISEGAQQLVRDVREVRAPVAVGVTGVTADYVDLKESLASHLPLALAIVVAATFLVLFLMTGSVILPVKAALMNLLTISAAFGVLILVFQDGRLEGLLDYRSQGGLETTNPVLLFVVVFGLSTDYAVFLLSRIKEARDAGADDAEAVALGLERTGRIVTAAALLFSVAVGALVTSEIIFIKQNGLGTAAAVLIDATIIRALLVPSLMQLLGRWNWWAPRPLRRLHERLGLREAPA
jgi:uncharacterized membrane protein YdfJ with MMPL/SSD domain